MTNEEIDFRCEMLVAWLQGYGKTNDADMLLSLKARAEAAEKDAARYREALQWYADNFVVNGSRAAAVLEALRRQ